VTVFDNVNWSLQCCKLKNWVIQVTWRVFCNLSFHNCPNFIYQFSKVLAAFWRSRDCFWQRQLVFTVLQAQKLNHPNHVTCILQFKFLQLSKFCLSIFQNLNCVLTAAFDNVNWSLQCCKLKNWVIQVTWRVFFNLSFYNCPNLIYQFSKV